MKNGKKQDSRTAFRLPQKQREEINQLISEDKFKNISQVIRAALTEFLKNEQES